MIEVKIYRGTYCGLETNVLIAKVNGWVLRLDSGEKMFEDNFTDLTELELHPKGEGVWVEGFNAPYLADMADFAENFCKINGFQNSERDFKKLKSVLAQLPTGETGGECVFLENDGRPSPNDVIGRSCKESGHKWSDSDAKNRCIWCGAIPPTAKVAIEQPETMLRIADTIARNCPLLGVLSMQDFNYWFTFVNSLKSVVLSPQPMEEPKEPEVGEVCESEPKGIGAMIETNTGNIWVRRNGTHLEPWVGLSFKHSHISSNSWMNLSGYSPILISKGISPTRIGGEK